MHAPAPRSNGNPAGSSGWNSKPRQLDSQSAEALARLYATFSEDHGYSGYISPRKDFLQRTASPPEIFSTLIILQSLSDLNLPFPYIAEIQKQLRSVTNEDGFVHFFHDKQLLAADTDCTAVALAVMIRLGIPAPDINGTIDKLLDNTNSQGIIEVYQKPAGERAGRIDANVLINILYLLYAVNREKDAAPSELFVEDTLISGAYRNGSRYYPYPGVFLYFLSRLVRDYDGARARFGIPLCRALGCNDIVPESFLDRALRAAAMDNLGLSTPGQRKVVRRYQRRDGTWPADAFFKYGRTPRYFGSEALSTAFGIRATQTIGGRRTDSPGVSPDKKGPNR